VQKLAEVLRVPLAYFYADDDLAELMLVYVALSEQHRIEIISFAKEKLISKNTKHTQ